MNVKKPVSTIEVSNDLSLVQRMAYAVILKHYHSSRKPASGFRGISVSVLSSAMGYVKKDFFYLDEQLAKLQSTLIRWLGDKTGEFKRVNFFSYTALEDGVFYYDFHPVLEDHIKNKKNLFALLEIGSMRLLRKKSSLALYELTAMYRVNSKSGFKFGTPFYSINDLRSLLVGSADKYKSYPDFNKYVLKPAVDEINAKTDLLLSVSVKKERRSVVAIKFNVDVNKSYDKRLHSTPSLTSEPTGFVEAPYCDEKGLFPDSSEDVFSYSSDLWEETKKGIN